MDYLSSKIGPTVPRLARIATIRADISSRLWRVNQGMSSEDYNELIDGMALLQFRFEQRRFEGS